MNLHYEARALLREAQYADAIGMPHLSTLGRVAAEHGTDRYGAWRRIKTAYIRKYGLA